MKQILLIGFMGSGKTTVGKMIEKQSNYIFVDTDDKIVEKTGKTISEIFAEQGEAYFRRQETAVLKECMESGEYLVISAGGGLAMQKENQKIFSDVGCVVYLRTSAETLFRRLERDTSRPLLQGGDKMQKITTLLGQRESVYESVADLIIDTDQKTVSEIAQEILEKSKNVVGKSS